ncbi:ribonuclease H family protein [Anoxybacillus sp. ST4]|uniref:ribonuclease H family protein n=1 Tax=Anoxybacillus sp. ST4 TaxID=2864181 RepID=UPI001C6404D6|nr:ribonuclease H family protein [Anoxybacillus sp. ST4]MBW7651835.1 ribonuclease H family protein [Anoxybacillus sp. ST4]
MKVFIEWTYVTRNKKETVWTSKEMNVEEALAIAEDIEKTGRVKQLLFYDDRGVSWSKKELSKLMKKVETEPHDVIAYFDGGFDRQRKKAGVGIVIYYKQNGAKFRTRVNAQLDELESNNEAEYAAFHFLLEQLEHLGVHHLPVVFRGDAHVVFHQLSGEWPVFSEEGRWVERIEQKMKRLGISPIYEPIVRKENGEADQLATQALHGTIIRSTIQLERG